jgi:hypothetical protein
VGVHLSLDDRDVAEPPRFLGLVDSGAWRTLLPRAIAVQLGIDDLLVADDESGEGVGITFPTWSYPPGLMAQIFLDEPELPLWGTPFRLEPGFASIDFLPLLGRADFFRAFVVRFDEPGQVVELDQI